MSDSQPTNQSASDIAARIEAQHAAAEKQWEEWWANLEEEYLPMIHPREEVGRTYALLKRAFIDAYILGNNDDRIMSNS